MKIIALEGLDKSGKHSQANLLIQSLADLGFVIEKSEFHRYDQPTGRLIMDWLVGKWDVDQLTIELVMAADKQAQQQWFDELEEAGIDILILDRYTASQKVYSMANNVSPMWTAALQQHMRKPDIEILIDIPPEESMSRRGKHNDGENDRYESDIELLSAVRELYKNQIDIVIDGMQSIDDVHQDILRAIQPHLQVESASLN